MRIGRVQQERGEGLESDWGSDSSKFQIVHLPVEPALFTFGRIAYGNDNGDQRGRASHRAADPLILQLSLRINNFHEINQ